MKLAEALAIRKDTQSTTPRAKCQHKLCPGLWRQLFCLSQQLQLLCLLLQRHLPAWRYLHGGNADSPRDHEGQEAVNLTCPFS